MAPSELEALLIDGSSMLEHLSRIQLDGSSQIKAINGQELSVKDEVDEATNEIRMCDMSGNLIAVGRYDAKAGVVRPIVVLKSVND
jgi:tRNA U55 pseudouridine synthase TruB